MHFYIIGSKNKFTKCSLPLSRLKQKLYSEDFRRDRHQLSSWEDSIAHMRYTHFSALLPLQKRLKEQQIKEEEERKRRDAEFPLSIDEFKAKPKDIQHRVAVFLTTSDLNGQEKMLSEYGWAWRQVKPLQEVYDKNVSSLMFLSYLT